MFFVGGMARRDFFFQKKGRVRGGAIKDHEHNSTNEEEPKVHRVMYQQEKTESNRWYNITGGECFLFCRIQKKYLQESAKEDVE